MISFSRNPTSTILDIPRYFQRNGHEPIGFADTSYSDTRRDADKRRGTVHNEATKKQKRRKRKSTHPTQTDASVAISVLDNLLTSCEDPVLTQKCALAVDELQKKNQQIRDLLSRIK